MKKRVHKLLKEKTQFDLDMAMDTLYRLMMEGGECYACTKFAVNYINQVLSFETLGEYPIEYKIDKEGNVYEEDDDDDDEDFYQNGSVGRI